MTDLIVDSEFKDLIPPLEEQERAQLEENILRDGIQAPLTIWNNIIVDGHNRYAIAQKHNLPFKTVAKDFDDRHDAKIWILKNQLGRRNVTPAVRIKIALLVEEEIAQKAKARQLAELKQNAVTDKCPERSVEVPPKRDRQAERENTTNYQLAKMAGVSDKSVQRYKKVLRSAPKEIVAQVDSGEISINEGYKQVKQAEKAQRQAETCERKAYTPPVEFPADDCQLFCADIREGLPQVADNSVDFIITDPPYPKEFLPLYEDLSKLAARVLKDGGSLICMSGQSYLPDVIKLLETNLTYHWCLSYVTMGNKTQIWQRRVHTAWKPLLWFVKGKYSGDWLGDDVMSSPNEDKEFHEWGQSVGGMKILIERLTNLNDVILDPFLGGGTTGLVAVMSKRKFIGVDIEQACVDTAKSRIMEAFNNG